MQFLKALLVMIVIPVFGFLVSEWELYNLSVKIARDTPDDTLVKLCISEILSRLPFLQPLCERENLILWMQDGSILCGVIAVLLLLSFVFFAFAAGKNRTRIAIIFPPLIFCSLLVLSILVLIEGVIITACAFLAASPVIPGVIHFLFLLIGIGAFVGAFRLIQASFKLGSKQPHYVVGALLSKSTNPKIHDFVKDISTKLKATPPDNIVVGLEPNFYVTSSDVNVIGHDKMLSGETLFISLPLLRILSMEEFLAVIGHELGHFRGRDTIYSRKFSPVYASLNQAISAMETEKINKDSPDMAKIPAFVLLSYMIDVFHRNVSAISREREFEADKAASEISSPEALATFLLKINFYTHFWDSLEQSVIARLEQGKMARNIPRLFAKSVIYDVDQEILPDVVNSIAQETVSHPTDSHPPTGTRIKQLGVSIESINNPLLTIPEETAINIIHDYSELEERISEIYQLYYVALRIQVPDESESDYGAMIFAALAAHMVLADGKPGREEIHYAEAVGLASIENFDRISFREYLNFPDSLPPVEVLVDALTETPAEVKAAIFDYLKEIAAADKAINPEEQGMLDQLRSNLLN